MAKINVGVVFGGKSAEHEVSLVSAQSIMDALDKDKYNIENNMERVCLTVSTVKPPDKIRNTVQGFR